MWKKILLILGIFSLVTFIVLAYLLVNITLKIRSSNFSKASEIAKTSVVILEPISKITFGKILNLELIKHIAYLIKDIPYYSNSLFATSKINSNDKYIFNIIDLKNTLEEVNIKIQIINSLGKKSSLIKNIANKKYLLKLDQLCTDLPELIKVLDSFSSKDQKIIVVFQNSDEIRATGGFMGSYAVLNIIDGKITEIVTEDIYDADGQFNGFIEAPTGVKEYLSDNKGLRLPNANWHPDFPTSAEQILQFFALGNKKNINTLVVVNLDYAKLLLNIVGDVTLIDYNTVVDSHNINEVLRSRRSIFFPGSKQKKHLLSQLITQLKIKLANLDEKSKLNIIEQTFNQLKINNIQLYSTINEIDEIFSNYNFRQELERDNNDCEYLFLIESNVGINKANKNITREVSLTMDKDDDLIVVNFKNNNLKPTTSNLTSLIDKNENDNNIEHLGYVNYQRVIIDPSWQLDYIEYNDQLIHDWNENIIKNSRGDKFKEIGFLITLKEQNSSVLKIKFKNNQLNKNKIFIQKQPGLPPTPYIVKKDNYVSQTLLENDFLFELNSLL